MFHPKSDQNASQNETFILDCQTPQEFITSDGFFHCFQQLFYDQIGFSIFLLLLIFFIGSLNILVIVLLIKKRERITVFDKLIIILCLSDAVTGLLDAPFYSIIQLFGYWPLNYTFGIVWASFDSGLCTISMMCMLHMTYIRLRSLQTPNTFEREFVTKKPILSAVIYWIIGFIVWIPITLGFGTPQFSTSINFQPYYIAVIVDFFLILLLLILIIIIGFHIVVLLYIRNEKKKKRKIMPSTNFSRTHTVASAVSHSHVETTTTRKKTIFKHFRHFFHFGPQTKFQFIIISYWVQWLPSLLIDMFNPFCQCVPNNVNIGIYWLTYTVSMTNPIMVLLFNPNVAVSKTNLIRHLF